jgi:hypothetical protein
MPKGHVEPCDEPQHSNKRTVKLIKLEVPKLQNRYYDGSQRKTEGTNLHGDINER